MRLQRPNPLPVELIIQQLVTQRVQWKQGGLDPTTGLGCYGLCHYAFALAGIALPQSAEEGQAVFYETAPPYAPWDLVLASFGPLAGARHVGLLLQPPYGYHCSWISNGVARFSLHQALWRRIIRRVLRYEGFCVCT